MFLAWDPSNVNKLVTIDQRGWLKFISMNSSTEIMSIYLPHIPVTTAELISGSGSESSILIGAPGGISLVDPSKLNSL